MTVSNDILIPQFKEAFTLDYFHAMLVQFAFFGAYFIGSLIYFIISAATGDPIARIGYKNGVIIGLLISATGSALFWPAATMLSYPLFLTGLFVVGLGFAMLQRGGKLAGFAIAGEDRKFYWADAAIEGDTIVVSSPNVPDPVAVRYAWDSNPVCNLYNGAGLPAVPFRTDNWPGITL